VHCLSGTQSEKRSRNRCNHGLRSSYQQATFKVNSFFHVRVLALLDPTERFRKPLMCCMSSEWLVPATGESVDAFHLSTCKLIQYPGTIGV
jgi:hypothetical protein